MKPETGRQSVDNKLFFYGGLVTLVLTFSAILNLSNSGNFFTLILFLPVIIYFAYLSFQRLRKYLKTIFNSGILPHRYFGEFSLKEFLLQTDWEFLASLLLGALAFFLVMLKVSLSIIK